MPARRIITTLLLAWTLGLGFIQAGVQPLYGLRMDKVPACSSGCEEESGVPQENCLPVCLIWCAMPGFSAMSEADAVACAPAGVGQALDIENFEGQVRHSRPPLPPPRG